LDSEAPKLALEPASVWRRLAAFCYDLLLLTALVFSFTLLVVAVRLGAPVPPGTWWFPSSLLAIAMLFFCGFWVHGGQTLGMRAWRIRVRNGGRADAARAARFAAGSCRGAAGLGVVELPRSRQARLARSLTGTRVVARRATS
jgi:uncharacterized RDD family membrane protein YckC